MKNNNLITIITQHYYGNRVGTEIDKDRIDAFILGNIDGEMCEGEKVDRTIINLPNAENLVLVYNKYFEEEELERKERIFKKDNYVLKPSAIIEELGLTLYSKCIVCRVNNNGEFVNLKAGDYEKAIEYLTE